MTTLRQGLLDGRAVALAGGASPAIRGALGGLGASARQLDPTLDEDRVSSWAAGVERLYALVYDARPAFAGGGPQALREAIENVWVGVRGVANGALIPAGAGKIVLIGPEPDAGSFAAAARAALENLARTLSVEWARYGVGAVAIAPGADTREEELAELVCFLASPAGEYFTGCVFEFGAVPVGG